MNVSLSEPVVRAAQTSTGNLGVAGARFILDGGSSQGRFSLVEHVLLRSGASSGQRAGGVVAGCSSKKRMNSALASGPWGSV